MLTGILCRVNWQIVASCDANMYSIYPDAMSKYEHVDLPVDHATLLSTLLSPVFNVISAGSLQWRTRHYVLLHVRYSVDVVFL